MDNTAAQPEDMTALVLSQALAQSRCSAELCSLSQVFHRGGWVVFSHAGASPHVCQVCKPGTLSLHIVSVEVLQGTERRELVADVARWLDHLHLPRLVDMPPSATLDDRADSHRDNAVAPS